MAHALELFFDADADAKVRALWRRLEDAGVPSLASHSHRRHRPHVTLAVAGTIPRAARTALRSELRFLSIPDLWLYTLGTFPGEGTVLLLGAVVDTEVLAVHSAVHDVLAGKVSSPSAYCFPGAWIPHCTLAQGITSEQLSDGFAALQPPEPIRAAIAEIGVADTRTGDVEILI
jgi:2'-5' RNA ligase